MARAIDFFGSMLTTLGLKNVTWFTIEGDFNKGEVFITAECHVTDEKGLILYDKYGAFTELKEFEIRSID